MFSKPLPPAALGVVGLFEASSILRRNKFLLSYAALRLLRNLRAAQLIIVVAPLLLVTRRNSSETSSPLRYSSLLVVAPRLLIISCVGARRFRFVLTAGLRPAAILRIARFASQISHVTYKGRVPGFARAAFGSLPSANQVIQGPGNKARARRTHYNRAVPNYKAIL